MGGAEDLVDAIRSGDAERVESLLGSDPSLVRARSQEGYTPLHIAVAGRWFEISKLLVESGAEVDARGEDGATPLHSAAQNADARLVAFLLDHGADPLAENEEGRSPLDLAATAEVVALLEDRAIPEP
jgi:ankyrin repeat protein